jgi:hypothetical protein
MNVKSFDIPQADRLESVVMAIIAVGNGAKTDVEIIRDIPGLTTDRQGRYYRNAAEILGFISNYRNHASLTELGKEFMKNPGMNNPLFISSVLNIEVIQRLLPFLEIHRSGASRSSIESYLNTIVDSSIGGSMIPRRTSTILSWLKALNVVSESNNVFSLQPYFTDDLPTLEVSDIEQPVLPTPGELLEYAVIEERARKAAETIAYYKDQAKLERANNAHIRLVNLVAKRIVDSGSVPKSNQLIDLATTIDGDFLFEMKSITSDNTRSQVRKGVSQLQEYRYLQDKKDAKLILVIENQLDSKNSWLLDYLENDQKINLIWDGDGLLHASEPTRAALGFLNLIS